MNEAVLSPNSERVIQAFGLNTVIVPIDSILPVRAISKTVKVSHKYRQIACSIEEIGLVEPPVVFRDRQKADLYLLLDGHLRVEVLKDLGHSEVECLLSSDDEAFTYNKRISRLSAIQEQRMIARALERDVPKEKIAKALNLHIDSLNRRANLIDGICETAVNLLRDKICPMAIFDIFRKMVPQRQIEAAELMVNANNYSIGYASAILAGTPQAQLTSLNKPRRVKGITVETLSRLESELTKLQQATSSVQNTYSQDHLHLIIVRGYLTKLVNNPKVSKYLDDHHPELSSGFKKIVELTSTG